MFKNPLYPKIFITAYTIKIDGITKEKPHKETIILTNFKFYDDLKITRKELPMHNLLKQIKKLDKMKRK